MELNNYIREQDVINERGFIQKCLKCGMEVERHKNYAWFAIHPNYPFMFFTFYTDEPYKYDISIYLTELNCHITTNSSHFYDIERYFEKYSEIYNKVKQVDFLSEDCFKKSK